MSNEPSPWTLDDEKHLEDIAREFRNKQAIIDGGIRQRVFGFADNEDE